MASTPKKGITRRVFLTVTGLAVAGAVAAVHLLRGEWSNQNSADTADEVEFLRDTHLSQLTKRVFLRSQEEAWRLGDNQLTPEHLLLGIVNTPNRVAVGREILKRLGTSPDVIGQELVQQLRRGPGTGRQMQLPPRAKRVIEYAGEEAKRMGGNYTGCEHLLIGILREREGLAAQMLLKHGVTVERVRQEIQEIQRF